MSTHHHTPPQKAPQEVTPVEREAPRNPASEQDLDKPPEGRDVPSPETLKHRKRDPDSPWMGGG